MHQFTKVKCTTLFTLQSLITGSSEIHTKSNSNWWRRDLCARPNTLHYFDRFIRDNNHIWRVTTIGQIARHRLGSRPEFAWIYSPLALEKQIVEMEVLQPAYGGLGTGRRT